MKARIVERRDRTRAAGLALSVVALHAWLLAGWKRPGDVEASQGAAPLQRFSLVPGPRTADAAPAGEAKAPRSRAVDSSEASPFEGSPPLPGPVAARGRAAARADKGAAAAPEGASAEVPAPLQGEHPVPVYPARLPPAASLHFAVRRATGSGTASWDWQPGDTGYQSRLVALQGSEPLFDWTSRGALDPTGLAPARFVDRRRGRSAQASNFERGRLSWSGSRGELPLPSAWQDRLSWMPQLAGIVAAEPARWQPGAAIELFVAGAHGDAETWRFEVLGWERVALADDSSTRALKLLRRPETLYGTRVEAWLDPARGWLPVRASWRNGEAFTELLLEP